MTVHFIGAGPGAADLITVRGRDLITASAVCLYAGSLVPEALLAHCPPGARIVNTAPLSLDQIIAEIVTAHAAGHNVARLHSGDLSVWSAMGEQLRRLRQLDIPYDVTPGVPSFAAAAAALGAELTLPGIAQSVVLTRISGRATAMPDGERLAAFAATGATLAIHLSIHLLDQVVAELTPHYGADCPAAVVWRASWPEERIVRASLGTLKAAVDSELDRTALMLVGRGKMDDARRTFQKVFDDDPTGDLADNALFWIGETYFAVGDYSNAMRYYERVTKEFAEENKAPDAMFKLGVAYAKSGDLGMARRTFDECIRKYPYSSAAASAKLELTRIKY